MIDKIDISKKIFNRIQQAAIQSYPNEMCGFLYSDKFIQVNNASEEPTKKFKIDAIERAKHRDAIALVHTHVVNGYSNFDPRTPSISDMKGQKETAIPWLIFATDGETITGEPVQIPRYPNKQYLNRPFIAGYSDCYSIVQDYYFHEFGTTLIDHDEYRVRDVLVGKEWFRPETISKAGFHIIEIPFDELKNGDLFLLDNGTGTKNHLGIFHNGTVLHQDELSRFDPFEWFIGQIHQILRHNSRMDK